MFKTPEEIEVIRFTNSVSSEAHKEVKILDTVLIHLTVICCPTGFGPEAKTQRGIFGVPMFVCRGNVEVFMWVSGCIIKPTQWKQAYEGVEKCLHSEKNTKNYM